MSVYAEILGVIQKDQRPAFVTERENLDIGTESLDFPSFLPAENPPAQAIPQAGEPPGM